MMFPCDVTGPVLPVELVRRLFNTWFTSYDFLKKICKNSLLIKAGKGLKYQDSYNYKFHL